LLVTTVLYPEGEMKMKENALKQIGNLGHSIWLDYIRRDLISEGGLERLIVEDGLCGMTSNPAIFKKAIVDSDDYKKDIESMRNSGKDATEIYEALSQADVQNAADVFLPVYDNTNGKDGYVSLEVNPHLAHDTNGTIDEARRLWTALNRPNVYIKVPGTKEGLKAIQQLISEGINVNVTLLFGLPRYREVTEAYIAGLEARLAQGKSIEHVSSVASFFVSRIDVVVDPILEKLAAGDGDAAKLAKEARGQVAIASAKVAYQMYKEIFGSERFAKLADKGAQKQRLLWASTGTKDPSFSDVKYVEALIGADTVDTIPMETLDAYRDHGEPKSRLEDDVDKAKLILQQLPELGIDIDILTEQLEHEGVDKFNEPFDKLMETLEKSVKDDE
jgi:transaldolase